MNTRVIKTVISLSLFVILTGVAVQAQDLRLKANIPFDFMYGDVTMPAGEYDVTKLNISSGQGVFQVRDRDCKNNALRPVMTRVTRRTAPTESLLIFNRYRENGGEVSYFLSQVWVDGNKNGFEFFKHRAEREAALRAARRDIITIVVKRVGSLSE